MKRSVPILILLLLSAVRGTCDGVSVIRVSDGKVVVKDSPGLFDTYRDMVLTVDDIGGKVAIIQWGRYKSTIKVLGLADGKCVKHSINIGRENGIDGAEYYDFASGDYIFHDSKGLHFFGKDSKPRELPNPLPRDYRASKIVACEDGFLIRAGNCAGDYRGDVVYRYQRSKGSVKSIYETPEGIRCISGGRYAIISEDIRGAVYSRQIVTIDLNGHVLSKVTAPMLSADSVSIRTNLVYDVGPWETNLCQLQEVRADDGKGLRKIVFPDVPGQITGIDVLDQYAVVDGEQGAYVLNVETKQTLRRLTSGLDWSCLLLMKFKGEVYCVACE